MANDDSLGGTRRARGVHDVGHVVDMHLVTDVGGVGVEKVAPGDARGPDRAGGGDQGAQVGRAGGIVEDALAGQNDLHAGQVEDAQVLGPAEACVQRDGNRPGLVNRHVGGEPLERLAWGDGQGHPVSGPEAVRDHAPGQLVGPGVPLSQCELPAVPHVLPGDAVGKAVGQVRQ